MCGRGGSASSGCRRVPPHKEHALCAESERQTWAFLWRFIRLPKTTKPVTAAAILNFSRSPGLHVCEQWTICMGRRYVVVVVLVVNVVVCSRSSVNPTIVPGSTGK